MTSKNEAKVTGHTEGRSEKRRRRGRERERERERERKEREKDPRLVVVRVSFFLYRPTVLAYYGKARDSAANRVYALDLS